MIQLNVFKPTGGEKVIDLCDNESQMKDITVLALKEKIIKELEIREEFQMAFGAKKLEDGSLVLSYGIKHMSTIHVVLQLPGGDGCGQDLEEQTNGV